MATTRRILATLNSIDREALEPFIREWRYRHGEPRACHAHWEAREDGRVRWFPAKVIDLHYADAHGQVRIDTETGKVTVSKNPDNKPKLDTPPVLDSKPDAPTYGMTPMSEKAA
jgi:hypothetical protein